MSQCAPDVSPDTMNALIMTESGANPYVIANVSDGTSKYFKDEKGAIEYAEKLTTENKRFSAGLTQIYSKNFPSLNLTNKTVFDPCTTFSFPDQNHFNPSLSQSFQTIRRNAFINNDHVDTLSINDLM
nr:transglycosylase SLT domain-containing protein [Escherichia coli]